MKEHKHDMRWIPKPPNLNINVVNDQQWYRCNITGCNIMTMTKQKKRVSKARKKKR